MRRRELIFGLAAGAAIGRPQAGAAKPAAKTPRIAYVSTNLVASPHLPEAFRQGLRELGYVEGRDIAIEWRSADGKLDRFPTIAAELVALHVDVIVAANTSAALAAKQATSLIPVVFAGPADPVSSGLVASLAQPGGNVTGLSSLGPELVVTHPAAARGRVNKTAPAGINRDVGDTTALCEKHQVAYRECPRSGLDTSPYGGHLPRSTR